MEYHVTYQQAEPEPIWLDVDGVHFPIVGPVAFFYKLFRTMRCEEEANRELYPWIMQARREWIDKTKAETARQQISAVSPYRA